MFVYVYGRLTFTTTCPLRSICICKITNTITNEIVQQLPILSLSLPHELNDSDDKSDYRYWSHFGVTLEPHFPIESPSENQYANCHCLIEDDDYRNLAVSHLSPSHRSTSINQLV